MHSTVKIKQYNSTKFGWRAGRSAFVLLVVLVASLSHDQGAWAYGDGLQGDSQQFQTGQMDFELVQNPTVRLGDGSKRLSDINILLPLQNCSDCQRAYKIASAINGCYQW